LVQDERIKANEWSAKKRCPVCADIAAKKIDLEGEQLFDDTAKKNPMFCPKCGHLDIRSFHKIGSIEIARTSERGDTQPWTHQIIVKCQSCEWVYVSSTNPCLGNPWDEIMGFERPMDQNKEVKRKIRHSNEVAIGLRPYDDEYTKDTKLFNKRYKSKRKVRSTSEPGEVVEEKESTFTYIPTKEEKRLPRFRKKKNQKVIDNE